ncbi:hypothetical protein BH09MYX1_BH09MYX1_35550 [soil metagenome]
MNARHPKVVRILAIALACGAAYGVDRGLAHARVASPTKAESRPLTPSDEDAWLAKNAWTYFEKNRLSSGFVASAAHFPATTMWDIASQFAGMVATRELGMLDPAEFDRWMAQALDSIVKLPLYKGELPNKAYNGETMIPTTYGALKERKEIGFSALDVGRMAIWLEIVQNRYPQHAARCAAVRAHWKVDRLAKDGQLMGTNLGAGGETWNQEGRLGYEQYGAYGIQKLGLDVHVALDPRLHERDVDVDGIAVPVDKRDMHDSVAHNYVTSEPYILDGLESGFKALPIEYAGRVLAAQARRFERTGVITAWSEDNVDQDPWFTYNSIYVDGEAWKTITPAGKDATKYRGSSVKAAVGWNVLFRTEYTGRLHRGLRWLADPKQGVFAGYYEETSKPNRALTVNTNGIVLEALLYAKVGMPLEQWAKSGK